MTVRIGVDVDGVSYHYTNAHRDWRVSVLKLGADVDPIERFPEPLVWHFYSEQWGMTEEEYRKDLVDGVNAGQIFWRGEPLPGFVESVKQLYREGYEVVFITSRDIPGIKVNPEEITKYWLGSHGVPYHEVHVSHDKTLAEFNIDVLLDDSPTHLVARRDLNLPVVAFDHACNNHVEGVDRVSSWSEFVDYVHENFPLHVGKLANI